MSGRYEVDDRRVTAIDLFCGAGGFSRGLIDAGIEVLLGVDSWPVALTTYGQNFDHPTWCADLEEATGAEILRQAGINSDQVDLIVGGPPCQGFSVQRIGADTDHRNNLILEFARLVREIRPRLFIMENVTGLVGKRGRELFQRFVSAVNAEGFEVNASILNAADFGVPQIRRRVFVFGWLQGKLLPVATPASDRRPDAYATVGEALSGLAEPPELAASSVKDIMHRRTRLSALNLKRLANIPPGGGMEDLPVDLRVNCHKAGAAKIGHRYVYGRLAADRPAGTITGRFDSFTRGRFAHPHENRNITLREGARLQSFGDDFQFAGHQEEIAAQIGNAVPPLLAAAIGRIAVAALSPKQSKRGMDLPPKAVQANLQ